MEPIIVIDTREQNPYKFKGRLTVRKTLKAGDYSVSGFEQEIVIERKSCLDFLSSITRERERFKQELDRLKEFKRAFIVVEAGVKDLINATRPARGKKLEGYTKPITEVKVKVDPKAIINSIISIMLRYGVIFYFAENRTDAENFVTGVLDKYYSLKRKDEI
jgi:ERCC4-type nuclease